ncbi:MAG: NADPH:quinone oxidoreductase family protein [Betaproteobacteria bacterium]|nr:NADPH:quinone oxidoreductase family protein [Betaproteobacteria bacterium]
MHGWLCHNPTGADQLHWQALDLGEPGPGQVLVAVRAASLNFPDLLTVENKYQIKPTLPFVPGAEYAGVVQAVGPNVGHLQPGQHVAVIGACGGFATHAMALAQHCLPLPASLPFEHAAAFAFTYGTTHHALIDRGALRAGETVLVLGAAGGVGTSAIQVAKAAGAKVIAGVSSDEKAAFCKSLGADETLNYSVEDVRERLKGLTLGRGPDVVYDPVGGPLAEPVFRSIAWRGRYLVIGFAGGTIPTLAWNLALLKGASVVGVFWGDFVRREPKAFEQALGQLVSWYQEGLIKPAIDRILPMSELPQAYALMASRAVKGKLVMSHAAKA